MILPIINAGFDYFDGRNHYSLDLYFIKAVGRMHTSIFFGNLENNDDHLRID